VEQHTALAFCITIHNLAILHIFFSQKHQLCHPPHPPNELGLLPQAERKIKDVATGVMTGTANKNNLFLFSKQRSRHHNLLKENYGKPKKQDKESLRKQISSPGVSYVWGRC